MVPLLFIGTALGGAAMYLLDPQQGRRRRALLRDQVLKTQSNVRDILDAGKRDVSNRAAAATGRACSRENRVKVTRDETTSESGLGPAWIMPSRCIETSENGEAALRSSKARSFGCRPSPRDAARRLN